MELRIYSLEGTIFEGTVNKVSLPTVDGEITVLQNHIPIITILKQGTLKYDDEKVEIKGGFAEVGENKIVVLVS